MNVEPVLEADGLRPRRDNGAAFEHALDYQCARGRIVCLVGPNGGGKTAYLRALAGVDAIAAGRLRILGKDVARLGVPARRQLRRRVAFINEGAPLLSVVTGLSNVTLPAMYHRIGSAEAILQQALATLKFLEYPGRYDLLPAFLNQHQRLLLAIARCLMLSPELLFLDEPFHMADGACQQREADVYTRLARERNLAVLLATHNLGFVKRQADEIVFICPTGISRFDNWREFSGSVHPEVRTFLSMAA
jgi:ABC-type transporter Mla maintaining outer membrane lipid asymmetry ATPase subunit MlaF